MAYVQQQSHSINRTGVPAPINHSSGPPIPGAAAAEVALVAPAAAKSRLRDSCHACASSKVRCHKEKPTCSRCASRGITCEYYVTKRPGRRRGNDIHHSRSNRNNRNNIGSNNAPVNVGLVSPSSSTPQPSISNPYSDFHPTAIPSTDSTTWDLDPPLDLFPNFLYPDNSVHTDQDDVFASPIRLRDLDTSLYQTHNNDKFVAFSSENNTFSVFGEPLADLDVIKNESRSHSSSSSSYDIATAQALAATKGNADSTDNVSSSSACSCLTRALGLVRHSPPKNILRSVCSMSIGPESYWEKNPEAQIIMTENHQTVKVLHSILQCPRSQDTYVLAILAMVIFQVLDWYEAVAFQLPISSTSSPSALPSAGLGLGSLAPGEKSFNGFPSSSFGHMSSNRTFHQPGPGYCPPGEELSSRIAAQSILRHLHHVQLVVNQLSLKLKSQGTLAKDDGGPRFVNNHVVLNGQSHVDDGGGDSGIGSGGSGVSGGGGGGVEVTTMKIPPPFSTSTLDHISTDLQTRLRDLSIQIIDTLLLQT